MRTFSKKRIKINRQYLAEAKQFIKDKPCAIQSEVCTGQAQGVHHVKGRATIERLLDKEFWMPACNLCNLYVENNSKWAKENGFKLPDYSSKLSAVK